ncbi:hypothetical protein D3C84_534950 [compost metagenome]
MGEKCIERKEQHDQKGADQHASCEGDQYGCHAKHGHQSADNSNPPVSCQRAYNEPHNHADRQQRICCLCQQHGDPVAHRPHGVDVVQGRFLRDLDFLSVSQDEPVRLPHVVVEVVENDVAGGQENQGSH